MRKARKRTKIGFYHAIIRGVDKQNIFYSEEDKKFFKNLMRKYGRKYKILYHAYCLLDNHVHLLFENPKENLSEFMQVIASVYARYFNKKYDRIGHLYQDRFASEIIENNGYYVIALRYILQNAKKAGLCKSINYKWNSYHCYKLKKSLITRDKIFNIFGSLSNLIYFLSESNDDECLDMSLRPSEKEDYNIEKICKLLQSKTPIIKPDLPKSEIVAKIKLLKLHGLSIRTISRITTVGKWIVQNV